MSEISLLLDSKAKVLRLEQRNLRVELDGGSFRRFPLALLRDVAVYGSPLIESRLCRTLAERNIGLTLLPSRGQGDAVWLGSTMNHRVDLRVHQHAAARADDIRLAIARDVVIWKVEAALRCYAACSMPAELAAKLTALRNEAACAASIPSLMGLEGTAARYWYAALGAALPSPWCFERRSRRPPRDPVNALLSLTYTMIHGVVAQTVAASGLDPAVGFLHESSTRRAALALDLMEPLRPLADGFVLDVVQQLDPERHFTDSELDGCRLVPTARARYFRAWYEWCDGTMDNGCAGLRAIAQGHLGTLIAKLRATESAA